MFMLSIQYADGCTTCNELFASRESAEQAGIESGKVFSVASYRPVQSCQCWEHAGICELCAE